MAEALKGVPWKRLNERYKKYSKVMDIVFEKLEKKGIERERVEKLIDEVMKVLNELRLEKGC